MRERPILLNGDMVRAVLNGSKTQTRRIMTPQPADDIHRHVFPNRDVQGWLSSLKHKHGPTTAHICPFGAVGDRLWVRETWSDVNLEGTSAVAYRADEGLRCLTNDNDDGDEDDQRLEKYSFANWYPDLISGTEGIWRPSIHMPRWASRITLEITGVRVERLQDISHSDAKSEGCWYGRGGGEPDFAVNPSDHFPTLWASIYGEESWQANPWVWVIEFKRVEGE